MNPIEILVFAIPMLACWIMYVVYTRRRQIKAIAKKKEAKELGLFEPPSLHPVIDPTLCLGCGACTRACPEGDILGLINGKAELVEPSHCIGHGACKASCPVDAITLVFGTEKRGVDIPLLDPNFETHAKGIFIAGELGGMGLIRNAIEQGVQALDGIAKIVAKPHKAQLDLLIVGAGPAGIAAALEAKRLKLKFEIIEQDSLGGTVAHFPRNKVVMTAPANLPIIGKVNFRETTKEALLEFWEGIIEKTSLAIKFGERLEDIIKTDNMFKIVTNQGEHLSRCVLLCMGRRGTPRTLNVPGEERSKVVYRLVDAIQYRNQHVLVVGGGDSALEAATSIAEESGTQVTLSYRADGFSRAKLKNRENIDRAVSKGRINLMLSSQVLSIEEKFVVIEHNGAHKKIANDAVIICAGGVLPSPFLQKIGVTIETKHGEA